MEIFKTNDEYFRMAGIHHYYSDPNQDLIFVRFSNNLHSLVHSTPMYRNDFFEITLSHPQKMRFSINGLNQEVHHAPVLSCISPLEIQQCTANSYSGEIQMILIRPELLGVSNYKSPFYQKYPLFDPKEHNNRELSLQTFSDLNRIFKEFETALKITSSIKDTFENFYLKLSKSLDKSKVDQINLNRKEEIYRNFLYQLKSSDLSCKSIKHIAEEMAISYTHLSDTVKEVSTSPPTKHLKNFLNQLAKSYLLYTKHSCNEIAFELGFSSEAHFSFFFKEMNRIPPSLFRKNPKNM